MMDVMSGVNNSSVAQVLGGVGATGGGGATRSNSTPVQGQSKNETPVAVDTNLAKEAIASINEIVQVYNKNVEFSVDDATGINVVRVIDKVNSEVILQLPVDAVIAFARTMDTLKGMLVKQQV